MRTLRGTAQRVDAAGVTNAHDLTGRIFQRLIADRKYLATFYTLPAAAAKMEVDWSDAQAIGDCGLGISRAERDRCWRRGGGYGGAGADGSAGWGV